MNISDDYLSGDYWSIPAKTKVHTRPIANAFDYKKRPAPAIRFCERCDKQLTRYNKKSKCYSCQDKKKK